MYQQKKSQRWSEDQVKEISQELKQKGKENERTEKIKGQVSGG